MALHIKDEQTDELIRTLARNRGVGITQAMRMAAEEALAADEGVPREPLAETRKRLRALRGEIREMAKRVAEFGDSIDRQFGPAEGRTKVVVDYFADGDAMVLVAHNDEIGLAADAHSIDELHGKVRLMAATVLEIDPTRIDTVLRPVMKTEGYKFASPEDELRWREQKALFDDLSDGPKGDFSKTDVA